MTYKENNGGEASHDIGKQSKFFCVVCDTKPGYISISIFSKLGILCECMVELDQFGGQITADIQ